MTNILYFNAPVCTRELICLNPMLNLVTVIIALTILTAYAKYIISTKYLESYEKVSIALCWFFVFAVMLQLAYVNSVNCGVITGSRPF